MRVLMFGWEFPPHISGGLGTACFGLTQSLSKSGVEILFVVPKLHGDESINHVELISASNIPLTANAVEGSPNSAVLKTLTKEKTVSTLYEAAAKSESSSIQYIEVQSALIPYESTTRIEEPFTIEHWSYELKESKNRIESLTQLKKEAAPEKKEILYNFSGTYGPNLFKEVDLYAAVAREIAARFPFDVIHAHDWMTFKAGIAAKEVSGKPLTVHVHATEFDRAGDHISPHIYQLEKSGMEKADQVFTVSKRTKEIAIAKYGIPENKIRVVYNGVLPKENQSLDTVPRLGSHVVTFLGRVTHQKGPQYFVEAARLILKEFPDAHFIMAGSGDLLPHIIKRVAQLRLSTCFHFTGFLKGDKIDKVWAMSDVYVMPSVSEPFGIAPLEAIQGGVPVVLSNQSGVSEIMPHAMKVDFWDIRALANSIVSILRYKSLSDTLKKYSKEELETISWDNVAKKIKQHYHELAEQS